ncbi:hypothetical protein C8R46DRAFT_1346895 [Mycena filopes]|nr:hypothetical protein C8R46DRAFT_1346895 [Mycena filopes]
MGSNSSPCFPLELERDITETAAYSHPQTIPALLLVSRRVREWIERIKYRTVTAGGGPPALPYGALIRAIRSNTRPPDFFRDRVQHLFAGDTVGNEVAEVLSVCTGIQSLVIRSAPMTLLGALRPRRLSIFLQHLLKSPHRHPMYSLITHLEVLDALKDFAPGSLIGELALLPSLTHVALYDCSSTARDILARCTMLKLLVDEHYSKRERDLRHPYHDTIDDVRFVSIVILDREYIPDWVLGTRRGRDFWARGDLFVAKRRRGEIHPTSRCWIEDGDGI